jgi:DNA-binding transcriptional LysR family regulator
MPEFDWNDLRAFLAVVRTGRLVTAAHQLGMDQSTLSRRISGLEKALQTRLFDRTPTGYALTTSGETLVSQAEEIERLTIDIGSRLANADSALAGPIRIGTPEGFGTYFLAPLLNKLTQAHPELEIELVAVPGAVSLFKREADLAVTISPPEKRRFKTRRLLDYELGLYASKSYLNTRTPPTNKAACGAHPLIGYIDDILPTSQHDYVREALGSGQAQLRVSNIVTQLAATRAGAGLCILPCYMTQGDPELVRLLSDQIRIFRSYWLVVHCEARSPARNRLVTEFLGHMAHANRRKFLPDEAG